MGKYDELERLLKLKEDGVLSEQEFEIEKKKILGTDEKEKENEIQNNEIKNSNENIVKNYTEKIKTSRKKNIKKIILSIIIPLIACLIISGIIIISSTIQRKQEEKLKVTVPNLVGKTLSDAKEELSNLELNLEAKYPSLYSDSPDAIIQSQDNKEGSILKKGSTIKVTAKTQEQLDKEKQEEEERKKKQEEAKEKGYRSSPATTNTIVSCAKTLINNELRSSSTAVWGKCEKVDEDNYGRCLVYVSLEAQNGFGAYSKLNYFVVLQYVESNGEFTYKPYGYRHELTVYGAQSVYDYYVTTYKNGNIYPVIQTFLNNNDWNIRPSNV